MDCIFCKIINKESDAYVLYEDDIVIIILDVFPYVDGHALVIPKNHYEDFTKIPDDVLLHINKVAKEYTEILLKKLNKDSFTLLVNYKDSQKVKHYHLHLMPGHPERAKEELTTIYNILK